MALQVWLPLNGDLTNLGANTFSVSGSPTYRPGKLGQGLNLSTQIAGTASAMSGVKKWSVCFWAYCDVDTSKTADWVRLCFLYDKTASGSDGSGFRFETCYTTGGTGASGRGVSCHNNAAYAISEISTLFNTKNVWSHICVTTDGSNVYAYKDGTLLGTVGNKGGYLTGQFYLGSSVTGVMNDFRLYDHCLSQQEINDLQLPLIGWYKLNQHHNNHYFGTSCNGEATSLGLFTKANNGSNGWRYTLNYTGTGSDAWASIRFGASFPFQPGKTYMWNCKVRCVSCSSNVALSMRTARMDNDYNTPASLTVSSSGLADNQWHEYRLMATLLAQSVRSGTSYETKPQLEFYTGSMPTSGTLYSMVLDIKDVLVTLVDTPLWYEDYNAIEQDYSGYGNHGTVYGMLKHSASSIRNNYCIDFNKNYSSLCPYDSNIYTEPDGTKWVRIAHHNNPSSSGLFASSDTFLNGVYKSADKWVYGNALNFVKTGHWDIMVKLKPTSGDAELKHRWTLKTNPLAGTYADVSPTSSKVVRNTSSGYSTSTTGGGMWHMTSPSAFFCIANASEGNWYGAIGSWTTYNTNQVPGYPNTSISTGYIDLYMRVDGFIGLGRKCMASAAITVSLWGYMEDWSRYNNMISCTESGGWNFEPSGTKINWPIYIAGLGYVSTFSKMDYKDITPGWHHFCGTFDGQVSKFYIDGELQNLNAAVGTIGYNTNNGIFIAAEAAGNQTDPDAGIHFDGKLSDLRIYAGALSVQQVQDLYSGNDLSYNIEIGLSIGVFKNTPIDDIELSINSKYNWNARILTSIDGTNWEDIE